MRRLPNRMTANIPCSRDIAEHPCSSASCPDTEHGPGAPTLPTEGRPRDPILVTGAPRSGSTWVGNILALEPRHRLCPRALQQRIARPGAAAPASPTASPTSPTRTRRSISKPCTTPSLGNTASAAELNAGLARLRRAARLVRDFAYFETDAPAWGARSILEGPDSALLLGGLDGASASMLGSWSSSATRPPSWRACAPPAGHRYRSGSSQDQPATDAGPARAVRRGDRRRRARQPDPIDAGVLLWRILHHHIDLLQPGPPGLDLRAARGHVARDPVTGVPRSLRRSSTSTSDKTVREQD